MPVLVTSATSKVGREVVKALAERRIAVRALVRNPRRAAELELPGVELVRADLSRPDQLDAAMGGVSAVFLHSGTDPEMRSWHANVIAAARRAGSPRVVRNSHGLAAPDSPSAFCRLHWESERDLELSGLPYTHLRPRSYMQSLPAYFGHGIVTQGALLSPVTEGKVAWVDVRDLAAVAVAALTESGHEGRTYEVSGPEALSYGEVASALSGALHRDVPLVPISPDHARHGMIFGGLTPWTAEAAVAMFGLHDAGHDAGVTGTVREVTGREPRGLKPFLQEHSHLLRPAPASYPTTDDLVRMADGIRASGILRAALEVGIPDAIHAGHGTAAAVARAVGADERAVRLLLSGLVTLGLVEHLAGEYRLSPTAAANLVSTSPAFLGGLFRIFLADVLWEGYRDLASAVRTGGTSLDAHVEQPEHAFWTEFAASSPAIAGPAAESLVGMLAPWAAQRESLQVLDVACGSGLYGLIFARAFPQARVASQDWDTVLERVHQNADRMGVASRVRYLPGNMFERPLEGPYDLAILSHVLHHFEEDRCVELLRRVGATLAPGAKIVVNEFVAGSEPGENPFADLFSLNMLVLTRRGQVHGLDALRAMLGRAGFGEPVTQQAGMGVTSTLLVAERA
jgi:C-methyltransferase